MLTGTYNASTGTLTLYVNGAQSGTAGTGTTPFQATGALDIGDDQWEGAVTNFFDGSISDVQAYQRLLSPSEIAALYSNGSNAADNAANKLTTTWSLDQCGLPAAMSDPDGNTAGRRRRAGAGETQRGLAVIAASTHWQRIRHSPCAPRQAVRGAVSSGRR